MESIKSKRGMVNQLTAIAFGIVGLIILVGLGMVVITKLADVTATCSADKTYNITSQVCQNATGTAAADGAPYAALNYGITQLGSTGLLSWLPAVIALLIGVFFLAYFAGGRNKGKSY